MIKGFGGDTTRTNNDLQDGPSGVPPAILYHTRGSSC